MNEALLLFVMVRIHPLQCDMDLSPMYADMAWVSARIWLDWLAPEVTTFPCRALSLFASPLNPFPQVLGDLVVVAGFLAEPVLVVRLASPLPALFVGAIVDTAWFTP